MARRRLRLLLGLTLVSAGCGSSGTPTVPAPIPAASITGTGSLNVTSTGLSFSVRNDGPGCASTTDLAGTVTLTGANGSVFTVDWTLTLGEKQSGIFRPNEVKAAQDAGGILSDSGGARTWSVRVTKQTNVRCQ